MNLSLASLSLVQNKSISSINPKVAFTFWANALNESDYSHFRKLFQY